MGILDFLKSGTPPKEERGRGGAGTITGRQMPPEKSVKEKKKAYYDKFTTSAGSTEGNPYKSKNKSDSKGTKFGAAPKAKKVTGVYPKTKGSYKIKKGDTLSAIAKREGTTVAKLMALNPGIKNKNNIRAGAGLNLASKKKTVKKKDQLYSRKYSPNPNSNKTKKFKTITSKESGIPDSQPFSKGGMAQGYGRAAMRPGKDPRTISKT